MASPAPTPQISSATKGVLLGAAAIDACLAIYQWLELIHVRQGGETACAINETINCATVWNSSFAANIHDALHVPVAGLGLVWALTALILTALALKQETANHFAAVKVTAIVGAMSTLVFAGASLQAKALCLTCLGTYALVVTFAVAAFGGLPEPRMPQGDTALGGMGWALAVASALFLMALVPGNATPKSAPPKLAASNEAESLKYLNALPERDALLAALARERYQTSTATGASGFPVRSLLGPADAPVKIVDFTDVLCPHCKHLEEELKDIRAAVPKDSFSVEPRMFPLDSECNNQMQHTSGDGVRCMGAKALICLEGAPGQWTAREEMFEAQQSLSKDKILEIASKAMPRDALEACIASPETQKRLDDDIGYALKYGIEGTPLVLINGRASMPSRAFILGMVLSKGDSNAPYFQKLPPPPQLPEK